MYFDLYLLSVMSVVSVCCRNVAVNGTTTMSPTTTPSSSTVSFDVASFFGGIILGAAVVALSVVAWKCYQHRRQASVPYSAMAQ